MSNIATLILPGLGNSGPDHWQSHWEQADASCRRVVQAEWESPARADWVATLDAAVAQLDQSAVLVAHSTACALVAHWAGSAARAHVLKIVGALLVAPSDPDAPNYPAGPTGFSPVPLQTLPFPSIVVASENDEWVTMSQASAYAKAWGSELVSVGKAGHINSASGLSAWPQGYALLQRLRRARRSRA